MTIEYVCFLITNKCNLKCDYCYRMESDIPFMPEQDFNQYLNKLKNMGCKVLNITGGETLLHPKWKEYVAYAKKLGYRIVLSTNGLLLDINEKILNDIDVLVIPLDGSKQEIDAIYRGDRHFEAVSQLIESYKVAKFPFRLKINTVLTKRNYHDMQNILLMLEGSDIYWRIFYYKQKGTFNTLYTEDYIEKIDYIRKIKELSMKQTSPLMVETCMQDVNFEIPYTVVTPDGKIYISIGENDEYVGNLNQMTEKEILNSIINHGYEFEKRVKYCGI